MGRVVVAATHDGADDWSVAGTLSYRAPIGSNGAYIEAFGGNAFARREFGELSSDLTFEGQNAAVLIGYPLRRTVDAFDYLLTELEFSRAESQLGEETLASEARALRVHWTSGRNFHNGGLLRFGFTSSIGERANTATFYDGNRQFAHVRAEVSAVLPLDSSGASSVRLEAHGQLADEPLPAVERFNAGHTPFLRGYAPSEASGDRGVSGTIEFAREFTVREAGWRYTPSVFLSAGRLESFYPTGPAASDWTLSSIGFGSDLQLGRGIMARGWVAWPLSTGPRTEAGEPAVYFGLSKSW